jgi:hypothetical protein
LRIVPSSATRARSKRSLPSRAISGAAASRSRQIVFVRSFLPAALPQAFPGSARLASALSYHASSPGGRGDDLVKRQVLRTRRPTGLEGDFDRRPLARHVEPCVTVDNDGRYARRVGHILPAGTEAAKSGANPALSRNCDAPLGDESGRPSCAEANVSPRRKGGLGGARRRASSSAEAELFV